MSDVLKTSEEWMKTCPWVILLDPDGWDRKNYDYSFKEEKIDYNEFQKRLSYSTIRYTGNPELEKYKQKVRNLMEELAVSEKLRTTPYLALTDKQRGMIEAILFLRERLGL